MDHPVVLGERDVREDWELRPVMKMQLPYPQGAVHRHRNSLSASASNLAVWGVPVSTWHQRPIFGPHFTDAALHLWRCSILISLVWVMVCDIIQIFIKLLTLTRVITAIWLFIIVQISFKSSNSQVTTSTGRVSKQRVPVLMEPPLTVVCQCPPLLLFWKW